MDNKKEEIEEVTEDTNDEVIKFLTILNEWFVDHPQASADCRNYIERSYDFPSELLDAIFGVTEEEFVEDDELDESFMSDLSVEVEEAGGDKAYIERLEGQIAGIEDDIIENDDMIEYLKGLNGPAGSNYDSQAEIDEEIERREEVGNKMEELLTTLTNKLKVVKDSIQESLNEDFNIDEFDVDVNDSYADDKESYIYISIYNKVKKEGVSLHFDGYEVTDLDIDTTTETWDDPGDYPSRAGGGPLPSYDYVVYDGISKLDPKTFKYDTIEYSFNNEDYEEITKEKAMEILGIEKEEDFDTLVEKAKQVAADQNYKDFDEYLSESDYVADHFEP